MVQERVMYTHDQAREMVKKIKRGRVFSIRGAPVISVTNGENSYCFLVDSKAYALKLLEKVQTFCHGECQKRMPSSGWDPVYAREFMCINIRSGTLRQLALEGSFYRKSKRSKDYIITMNKLEGYTNYCNVHEMSAIIKTHVAKYSKKGTTKL